VFTLAKRFDNDGEVEEAKEEDIEFLEAGEDSAEAFESPEDVKQRRLLGWLGERTIAAIS